MKITEEILNYLADEESKYIYKKRVEYNETGNFEAIKEIVHRYLPELDGMPYYPGIENNMIDLLKDKKKIVVFGCGMVITNLLSLLSKNKITIDSLVDNDANKWGKEVGGIHIKRPEDIDYNNVDAVVITPKDKVIVDQIHFQLQNLGWEGITIDYREWSPITLTQKQYFASDIIKLHENEVFVDAGALDLYSSKRFIEECRRNRTTEFRIYAFEPDAVSYYKCLDKKRSMMDVDLKLYNVGLWSEDTILSFDSKGDGASRITQQPTADFIKTVALDHFVSDEVTFIKMDIEGAELEALKGCRETIKRYKPKLAICVYHKKEDLIEIPLYIKELVPEYKLYIRHYSNGTGETVLYAVI